MVVKFYDLNVIYPFLRYRGNCGTQKRPKKFGDFWLRKWQTLFTEVHWLNSFIFRDEIEAAKTLLFGLSAGAGINAFGSSAFQSVSNASPKSSSFQLSQAANQPSTSRLNSKRAPSESNSESEEDDLGFGDSDYFHDNKYGKTMGNYVRTQSC